MSHWPDYPLPVTIPDLSFFHDGEPFTLESGYTFQQGITIAYHTYGTLNAAGDNVIWVCHALTANSRADDWWSGIFGKGKILDPERYFIVCANVLGSCYGTTCARSIDPLTDTAYGMSWPLVTIRDWVKAHDRLRLHLGIEHIRLCIGGSCGGHQVLEFACLIPDRIQQLGLLVTSARETPWVIAGHEAQRQALLADPTLMDNQHHSGAAGLKAARGIALLGYRTGEAYNATQSDTADVLTDHKASTYIRHQGDKLVNRFYAHCYWHLLRTLDTHHVGRGRSSMESVLQALPMEATIIGIDSDRLIPVAQQEFIALHMPNATLSIIPSLYGHDGFLIEADQINQRFLS